MEGHEFQNTANVSLKYLSFGRKRVKLSAHMHGQSSFPSPDKVPAWIILNWTQRVRWQKATALPALLLLAFHPWENRQKPSVVNLLFRYRRERSLLSTMCTWIISIIFLPSICANAHAKGNASAKGSRPLLCDVIWTTIGDRLIDQRPENSLPIDGWSDWALFLHCK